MFCHPGRPRLRIAPLGGWSARPPASAPAAFAEKAKLRFTGKLLVSRRPRSYGETAPRFKNSPRLASISRQGVRHRDASFGDKRSSGRGRPIAFFRKIGRRAVLKKPIIKLCDCASGLAGSVRTGRGTQPQHDSGGCQQYQLEIIFGRRFENIITSHSLAQILSDSQQVAFMQPPNHKL